jgi:hypothetical protein
MPKKKLYARKLSVIVRWELSAMTERDRVISAWLRRDRQTA